MMLQAHLQGLAFWRSQKPFYPVVKPKGKFFYFLKCISLMGNSIFRISEPCFSVPSYLTFTCQRKVMVSLRAL